MTETNRETERTFSHSALTVVALLQDVGRWDVHDLLQNKRKGLLRLPRSDRTAGLKRHCDRGFVRHGSCLTPIRPDRWPHVARLLQREARATTRRADGHFLSNPRAASRAVINDFRVQNNTTQAPCCLSRKRACWIFMSLTPRPLAE